MYTLIFLLIITIIFIICKCRRDYFNSKQLTLNKNNKIILCLFGVIPRGISKTWDSIKTNIINVLEKKNFVVDIYVFNINVETNKIDNVIVDQNDINIIPYDYYEEKLQSEIDIIVKDKYNKIKFTQSSYTELTIKNIHRQLYSEYRVGQFLDKNKNKYNLAITCCSDLFCVNKINLKHINNSLTNDYIYISNMNNATGLTNGFYFGKINKLSYLLNRYNICLNKQYYNYEQTLLVPIKENNIKYKFTDIIFFKIRANNKVFVFLNKNNKTKYMYYNYDFINDTYDNILKKYKLLLSNIKESFSITQNDENLLKNIHTNLKLKYGDFTKELPEQIMSYKYIKPSDKVLEIGGNIGRNSLVVSSILNNSSNLVVLESDIKIAKLLKENRDINNFNFHIEDSALSKRLLIQKEWKTKPSNIIEKGWTKVKTITYNELKLKYNINFNVLIIDCEGAFYYIIRDMPEILNNINLIIIENDYKDINHYNYVINILKHNNFKNIYTKDGTNQGAKWSPCNDFFYQVWSI